MSAPATGHIQVVVADDDAAVRALIGEYLRQRGLEVLEASNGLEVLLHVKRSRPAAVVLDLQMPRLGGLEALKRIRAFDPAIRAIVVTGYAEELRDQALAAGAASVLAKPVVLADLMAALTDSPRPPTPASSPVAEAAAPAERPGGGRILVVDDDPAIRAMLEETLAAQGYETRGAADGTEAVRAIVEDPPDVVLLDIYMPRLSGVEALPAIRALAPGAQVIMVSGSGDVEVAKRALAFGAFDYVLKPVDLGRLIQIVETAMVTRQGGE